MTHPHFRWAIAAGLLLAWAGMDLRPACAKESNKVAGPRPNIVFVLFDDMGWGQPPSYNPESELRTPHLDKLTREGMRFTDAHAAAAVCTPTRYGILTGRYPSRIGQFGVLTTWSAPLIPTDRLTVASLLQQNGYHTACVGKWHLGLNWVDPKSGSESVVPVGSVFTDGPNALGFDYFCGFTHARNIGTILEQDRVVSQVSDVDNQPLMISKALEWLGQQTAEEPFFLYFPMCPPHTPIVPAPEFIGRSQAQDLVGNDAKYGDWLFQGDAMLGQIVDKLKSQNLYSNTLIIATSDNGAEHRAYAPLRESKRSIYEGGHRVPFVATWPERIAPGSVCHQTICLNDLIATAADLLDARLPDDAAEDSFSLLPLLLHPSEKAAARPHTVHQSSSGDLALRQGAWKLIFHRDGQRELFSLDSDLEEKFDVHSSHPHIVQELTAAMQHVIDNGRSNQGARQRNEYELSLNPRAKPNSKASRGQTNRPRRASPEQ